MKSRLSSPYCTYSFGYTYIFFTVEKCKKKYQNALDRKNINIPVFGLKIRITLMRIFLQLTSLKASGVTPILSYIKIKCFSSSAS